MLRARGLRSTPQRRAILGAFRGGATEHLSADEVYGAASQLLPDLGRGTVYATLAEFSELGLLSSFGTPEPVRYETNTAPHAHFRCRLCLRLFDLELGLPDPVQTIERGFRVERTEIRVEGVCADCADYELALAAGARAMIRRGPDLDALAAPGWASLQTTSPLGTLSLAATPDGLLRVAFEDHADAEALRAATSSRRGSPAARRHLSDVEAKLQRYFAGATEPIECDIDWDRLAPSAGVALRATESIPYDGRRSYSALATELPARELGNIMGTNPIPILTPCHRVTRGVEMPTSYVGGAERRRWLELHERQHIA
jgi:Fe2+ or Zn2+ uptake regulation protein/O6-methylguanine-DNA--protein-cysteine methyltransferase